MKDIICWWSGGIASAVACKIAIDMYGLDRCRVVFIGTKNEDEDTYRFFVDCEEWYNTKIETITAIGPGKKYTCIEDVWYEFESLDVAHGAICSSELKRQVRIDFQRRNTYSYQVFGFDKSEPKRAANIKKNYPASKPIFPLLMFMYSKADCIKIIEESGIEIPRVYKYGFRNNNCFNTGCVQGGIGYWQKMLKEFPEKVHKMHQIEKDLTELKGKPVTICKDQSAKAKAEGKERVFLLPYLGYKDISMLKGRPVESLMECNGFCGIQGQLFQQV